MPSWAGRGGGGAGLNAATPALAGDSKALSALVTPQAQCSVSSKFKVRAFMLQFFLETALILQSRKVPLSQLGPDQILTLLILSHFAIEMVLTRT